MRLVFGPGQAFFAHKPIPIDKKFGEKFRTVNACSKQHRSTVSLGRIAILEKRGVHFFPDIAM